GVYLTESNGLTATSVIAEGTDNDIVLTATQGDIKVGGIEAVGGSIRLDSQNGKMTDHNGAAMNLRADAVQLSANGAIGTASDALETDASQLETSTPSWGAETFLANASTVDAIKTATQKGNVKISHTGGTLEFNASTGQLQSSQNGADTDRFALDFTSNGGDIAMGAIDTGSHEVKLKASGAITQNGGAQLSASKATLDAGKNIGTAGAGVQTSVESLDLNAADGDIHVSNTGSGTLVLKAKASGTDDRGSVTVSHDGDLEIDSVVARKSANLSAQGTINAKSASTGQSITAAGAELMATAIGTASKPLNTSLTGNATLTANAGGLFINNLGAQIGRAHV